MLWRCARWSKASGFSYHSPHYSCRRDQPLASGINRLASFLSQGVFCGYSRLVSLPDCSQYKHSENCLSKQYCSLIQIVRPTPAPFNSKMHPPAKKKKHGEAEGGEGGRAVLRAVGGVQSHHAIGAYEKISSHHAREARGNPIPPYAALRAARISASEKPLSLIFEPMAGIEPATSSLPWTRSTN